MGLAKARGKSLLASLPFLIYIRLCLTPAELAIAEKLYQTSPKHHIRQKAHAFLLSNTGHIVTDISKILGFDEETIRSWFSKWKANGFESFEIKKGRGLKPKLLVSNAEIIDYVKKR